jgi:hypothetical protein
MEYVSDQKQEITLQAHQNRYSISLAIAMIIPY